MSKPSVRLGVQRLLRLGRELHGVEFFISTGLVDQRIMCTAFGDAAVLDHLNQIGINNSR